MSSTAPRRSPAAQRFPLIGHEGADAIAAWRGSEPVTAAQFLADAMQLAKAMPHASHVLNFCADRYRFALGLCAAIVRGQVTLLPPAVTPHVMASMRAYAPDAYCLTDAAADGLDVPRFEITERASAIRCFRRRGWSETM